MGIKCRDTHFQFQVHKFTLVLLTFKWKLQPVQYPCQTAQLRTAQRFVGNVARTDRQQTEHSQLKIGFMGVVRFRKWTPFRNTPNIVIARKRTKNSRKSLCYEWQLLEQTRRKIFGSYSEMRAKWPLPWKATRGPNCSRVLTCTSDDFIRTNRQLIYSTRNIRMAKDR